MKKALMLLPAIMLVGCFTLHRTPQTSVSMTRAPEGRDVKVALSGFAATITEYIPVYGYETVYVDGGWHGYRGRRGGWYGGHYATATTETLIPQVKASEAFLRRAQAHLEEHGFLLRAAPADYTMDVTFDGPFVTASEQAVEWAWMLCSILSAEYSTQTWTAKLNIYDNKTGRIIFHRDYKQKFEDVVWSPLFFVGLAGYGENTFNYMQSWCLSALTDHVCADATSFLAGK